MPLCKHRTLFVSSRDRVSGDRSRFRVNLSNLLFDLQPVSLRAEISRVDLSLSNLYIPLAKNRLDRVPRRPAVLTSSGLPPPVRLINVHTSLPMSNISSSGDDSIILQLPFMDHYRASVVQDVAYATAPHVGYREQSDKSAGVCTLLHGPSASFDDVEFWLTDEADRLILPEGDWYMSLTIYSDTCDEVDTVRRLEDIGAKLEQSVEVQRLLLMRFDNKDIGLDDPML